MTHEYLNGTKFWYKDNSLILHREDGPAIEYASFIKGEFIGDGEGYNIEYCSDEYFHSKLNRFLNLKAFF